LLAQIEMEAAKLVQDSDGDGAGSVSTED
jgi:hypothetical protein